MKIGQFSSAIQIRDGRKYMGALKKITTLLGGLSSHEIIQGLPRAECCLVVDEKNTKSRKSY